MALIKHDTGIAFQSRPPPALPVPTLVLRFADGLRRVRECRDAGFDAALEHFINADVMTLGQRLQRRIERYGQADRVLGGLHDAPPARVREALSDNAGIARISNRAFAARSDCTLGKWRKMAEKLDAPVREVCI